MTPDPVTCVIGIDGGGTACRFALRWPDGRHDITLGPANVTTDPDGAIATLLDGLHRLADQAGLPGTALARIRTHAGLAGVVSEAQAAQIADALPVRDAQVTDDRMTTLVGALGAQDGAVLSVGTGSFIARRTQGACRFVGGWGLMLGDEASGAWLGRRLLSAVLQAEDGLHPHTDLTRAILSEFADATAIILFAQSATPGDFAAYAPRVAEAGDDATAARLMEAGARYLQAALAVLGWQPEEPLCLLGGLGPRYANWLPPPIRAALTPPRGSALDGALALARTNRKDGTT